MKIATLDVSPHLLTALCRGLVAGDRVNHFQVTENGLPRDVEYVSMSLAGSADFPVVRLYLTSESFTEGEELPQPVLKLCASTIAR